VQADQCAAGGVGCFNETHDMKMVAFSLKFDLPSQQGIDASVQRIRKDCEADSLLSIDILA